MTLGIATTNTAVSLFNAESGRSKVLHQGFSNYFGITCDHNNILIGVGHMGTNAGMIPRSELRQAILVLDDHLNIDHIEEQPFETLGRSHQLFFEPKGEHGRLFWCMSADDAVWVCDYATGKWKSWCPHPHGCKPDKDKNNHHFNSVYVHKDRVYVIAQNRLAPPEVICSDTDLNPIYILDGFGNSSHNFWIEDGMDMICSSADSCIIDHEGKIYYQADEEYYVRGYSFDGTTRVVGVSYRGPREKREGETVQNVDANIHILDKDWNFQRSINLPSRFGQVMDVRLLSHRDVAHNGMIPPVSVEVQV